MPHASTSCRRTIRIALFVVVTGLAFAASAPPEASAAGKTNQIRIAYVPPKNPDHAPLFELLKKVRSLEKAQKLLSPIRLPRRLLVKMEGCDGVANAWYYENAITICYEYLEDVWRNAPKETTPEGIEPVDAILGPFFDVVLHEFGHAAFDLLQVPVFGREEDAADQMSTFMMLQFTKDERRRLISGTAYSYAQQFRKPGTEPKIKDFANEHGTPAQRFFNVLCIAYGSDPKQGADLVTRGYLPASRAEGCEDEYASLVYAFKTLIAPHIDKRMARRILGRKWLPHVKTRPPRPPPPRRAEEQPPKS
jgi:hypothetical protein